MADMSIPDLIRTHYADLVSGDEAAIERLVGDDFVQEWPQSGERIRGKEACLLIARNYPGGPPEIVLDRITGEGTHWTVEAHSRYPDGSEYRVVSLLEVRDGKLSHEVDYFGQTYPAPGWRAQWVERIEE